ncbi:60S ribosomal protein L14 [Portunus trituberculatus]|uniref:60S ribosomal protein L14 n=1 Tax=Portunus trituberculatus TaxID=210409 RepID=A0A5B7DZN3_PORTR|nr:60S ribosomal protein L14 [Portunus trituberculatus]
MPNCCSFLPQTFRKLIQIGRVVYLNEGPYRGKLAVVVDIIDCNKRSNMTDFDRYKLGRARQSRNRLLNRVHNHIRKQHFKALRVAKMKKDKKSK